MRIFLFGLRKKQHADGFALAVILEFIGKFRVASWFIKHGIVIAKQVLVAVVMFGVGNHECLNSWRRWFRYSLQLGGCITHVPVGIVCF